MRSLVAQRISDGTAPSVVMEVRDHCNRMVVRSNAELISIFMDLEKCTDRSHADNPCYYVFWEKRYVVADRMLFYKSWEWLMPVVRRINDLHTASVQDRSWNTRVKEVRESVVYVEIEVAYKAVIEFIKWYNAQPKCSSAIN